MTTTDAAYAASQFPSYMYAPGGERLFDLHDQAANPDTNSHLVVVLLASSSIDFLHHRQCRTMKEVLDDLDVLEYVAPWYNRWQFTGTELKPTDRHKTGPANLELHAHLPDIHIPARLDEPIVIARAVIGYSELSPDLTRDDDIIPLATNGIGRIPGPCDGFTICWHYKGYASLEI